MSTNRKLRRAQKAARRDEPMPAKSGAGRDKAELRRQTSAQRFATAGADRLWPVLLGWSTERVQRAWLLEAVHDMARAADPEREAAAALTALESRAPTLAHRLDLARLTRLAQAWRAVGDDYRPGAPDAHFGELARLCEDSALGSVTASDLQEDWELWTNLALAGPARTALLGTLAQTEQAALALLQTTKSDNVQAIASLARLAWVALAYADGAAFAHLREQAAAWLRGQSRGGPAE